MTLQQIARLRIREKKLIQVYRYGGQKLQSLYRPIRNLLFQPLPRIRATSLFRYAIKKPVISHPKKEMPATRVCKCRKRLTYISLEKSLIFTPHHQI